MDIAISEHTCATEGCGVVFYLTKGYEGRRQKDHKSFYCPNGHSLLYGGETDAEKLVRVTQEKNLEINRLNAELREKERLLRKKCRKPRTKK